MRFCHVKRKFGTIRLPFQFEMDSKLEFETDIAY